MNPRKLLTRIPFTPWHVRPPTVPLLRLSGVIGQAGMLRGGLTLQSLETAIERAFSRKPTAVALVINSPGGSPVQSALIAGRIRAIADEKKVPVIAFVEDVAASGGYWLACAADEIHADPSSILGSIGVISSGFGFAELLERFGVERRLYTAGERKSLLDSFSPTEPEDVARLRGLQAEIHESFKDYVRTRRGPRLTGDEADLFSGEAFTGTRALALGLIDGIGDVRGLLRTRFGKEVRIRPVAVQRGGLRGRLGLQASEIADGLLGGLEERLQRARFGL